MGNKLIRRRVTHFLSLMRMGNHKITREREVTINWFYKIYSPFVHRTIYREKTLLRGIYFIAKLSSALLNIIRNIQIGLIKWRTTGPAKIFRILNKNILKKLFSKQLNGFLFDGALW